MLLLKILNSFLLIYICLSDDFLSKFTQNAYKVKDIIAQVDYFDKNVMTDFRARTFKYNRTIAAINVSFSYKIDVKDKQEIVVQVFKLLSNQYREFPIRFQVSLSKSYRANIIGIQNAKKCGFINDTYFLKDVNYTICNFLIDDTKLPPLIPTGLYKVEATFSYLNKDFGRMSGTGNLYLPIYPPKEKKRASQNG